MTNKNVDNIRKIALTDELLKRFSNEKSQTDKATIKSRRGVGFADDTTVFNPCQLLYRNTDGNYTFADLIDGAAGTPRIQDGDYNHCVTVNTITGMREIGQSPDKQMILKPDGLFFIPTVADLTTYYSSALIQQDWLDNPGRYDSNTKWAFPTAQEAADVTLRIHRSSFGNPEIVAEIEPATITDVDIGDHNFSEDYPLYTTELTGGFATDTPWEDADFTGTGDISYYMSKFFSVGAPSDIETYGGWYVYDGEGNPYLLDWLPLGISTPEGVGSEYAYPSSNVTTIPTGYPSFYLSPLSDTVNFDEGVEYQYTYAASGDLPFSPGNIFAWRRTSDLPSVSTTKVYIWGIPSDYDFEADPTSSGETPPIISAPVSDDAGDFASMALYLPLETPDGITSFQLGIIGATRLWKPNPDEDTAPLKYKNGVSVITMDFGTDYSRTGVVRPAVNGGFLIYETVASVPVNKAYVYRQDRTLYATVPVALLDNYLA